MSSEETGGAAYGPLLLELLRGQETRKASVEQRGIAVVTTSGTLVTLLFVLVSVLSKDQSVAFSASANGPLKLAIPLFIASALMALATNAPLSYDEFDPEHLRTELAADWLKPKTEAEGRIAETRLAILAHNHRLNNIKGTLLLGAMLFEVMAIAMVGLAVVRVL